MLTNLQALFQHMEWADALVWNAVLDLPDPGKAPRLGELLYHIHTVQQVYLQLWQQQPASLPEPAEFETLAALCQWGQSYYPKLEAYLAGIDEAALAQTIHLPWAERIEKRLGKPPAASTLAETMLQVTSHSAYHRGQVNRIIREQNGAPPLVDFIAWVWGGKMPAVWAVVSDS